MMKQRVLTGITLLLILVAVFLAREFSSYFFDAFILLVCFLGSYESSKLFGKMGLYNSWLIAMIYPILAYACILISLLCKLAYYYAIIIQIALILLVIVVSYLIFLLSKKKSQNEIKIRNLKISLSNFAFNKSVHTCFAMLYPTIFLLLLTLLNHISLMYPNLNGLDKLSFFALFIAFLIPILTDTFGMIVGSLFKGKKLCEKISPKKTISGAVGGVVLSVLIMACVFVIFDATAVFGELFSTINLQIWHILVLTLLASIACECGDIFESWLKRRAGVKDSGEIFPAHGGILDRFDSHAFNAVIILLFFVIML